MSQKTIYITIANGGDTTFESSGFSGEECKTATAPFEEALGGQVISDEPTAEMFTEVEQNETVSN